MRIRQIIIYGLLWNCITLAGCNQSNLLDKNDYAIWCTKENNFIVATDYSSNSNNIYVQLIPPCCKVLSNQGESSLEVLEELIIKEEKLLQLVVKTPKRSWFSKPNIDVSIMVNDSLLGNNKFLFQEQSVPIDTAFSFVVAFDMPIDFDFLKNIKGQITTTQKTYHFEFDERFFSELPKLIKNKQ
jgi:hypothetical protein